MKTEALFILSAVAALTACQTTSKGPEKFNRITFRTTAAVLETKAVELTSRDIIIMPTPTKGIDCSILYSASNAADHLTKGALISSGVPSTITVCGYGQKGTKWVAFFEDETFETKSPDTYQSINELPTETSYPATRMHAFHPRSGDGISWEISGERIKLTLTNPDNSENQQDIIVASTENNGYFDNSELPFNHIMSAVKITIAEKGGRDATVTEAGLRGLYCSGTYRSDSGWDISTDVTTAYRVSTNTTISATGGEKVVDSCSTFQIPPQIAPQGSELYLVLNGTDTLRADITGISFGQGNCSTFSITLSQKPKSDDFFFSSENEQTLSLTNTGDNFPALEYSFDSTNWYTWDYSPITFGTTNKKLYIRGDNPEGFSKGPYSFSTFSFGTSSPVICSGNIMDLIDWDNDDLTAIPSIYCFACLFYNSPVLVSAPELPATTLADFCYSQMFKGCSSLTAVPELPAANICTGCYHGMFSQCTSLVTPPELPSIVMAEDCYNNMFSGCSSLATVPALPAETLAESCYYFMFGRCVSLINGPVLPAKTLEKSCYAFMFQFCDSLSSVTMLATDISATVCLKDWLKDAGTSATVRTLYVDQSMTKNSDILFNKGLFTIAAAAF